MRLARKSLSAISIAAIAALLAGCGGGGGSTPVVTKPPVSGSTKGTAKLTFHFNNRQGTSLRGRKYTSRATRGLSINYALAYTTGLPNTFAQLAGTSSFVTPIASGLNSNNATCTTAASDGSFSCSVLIPLNSGYWDMQFTTWDQSPNSMGPNNDGFGGDFNSGTANDLSTNTFYDQRIVAETVNAFNFALQGVVNSVSLALNPGTLVSGEGTQTATLTVEALDADGNIIIGNDHYVDVDGSQISINIDKQSETEPATIVGATPPPSTGNVTITGTTSFSDPTTTSTTVSFNGNETQSAVFEATTTSSNDAQIAKMTATLGFTNTTNGGSVGAAGSPAMNALSIAGMNGAPGLAGGNYGDAHLYVANGANNTIQQLNAGATPTAGSSWTIPTANAGPMGVVIAPDRQVWFTEASAGKIGAVDPATGHFTEFAEAIGGGIRTTVGPDGNVWVAETNGGVEKVTLAQGPAPASTTAYTAGFTGAPWGIVSDGSHLWVTESDNQIAEVDTSGNVVSQNTIPGAITLKEIAFGSDGNLWVTDPASNQVFVVSTAGALVAAHATTGSPQGIMAANDGTVYFTESGTNLIGRIAPATGLLSEYSNGVPADAPASIAAGSDGQIYYTASSGSNVYYFAP